MEPLDRRDSRRPAVQIAASVRAAILNGELAPGAKLQTGDELARYFGVAKATVGSAMRILRDEGYVRSVASSGNLRDRGSQPAGARRDRAPAVRRGGFPVRDGEAQEPGAVRMGPPGDHAPGGRCRPLVPDRDGGHDPGRGGGADAARTAALCLVHDTQETRTGDIDAIGRGYVTVHDPEAITARQVAGLVPGDAAKLITGLVAEYEANETPEAQLAHDADKIELILQADEYADQGHDTGPWREAALPALRTDAAKQLAQAITATPPATWYLGHRAAYERRWLRRPGNDAYRPAQALSLQGLIHEPGQPASPDRRLRRGTRRHGDLGRRGHGRVWGSAHPGTSRSRPCGWPLTRSRRLTASSLTRWTGCPVTCWTTSSSRGTWRGWARSSSTSATAPTPAPSVGGRR